MPLGLQQRTPPTLAPQLPGGPQAGQGAATESWKSSWTLGLYDPELNPEAQ